MSIPYLSTNIPGNLYASAADRVMWMRSEYGISMSEAKLRVWKDDMLAEIAQADDIHDIKRILRSIVDEGY